MWINGLALICVVLDGQPLPSVHRDTASESGRVDASALQRYTESRFAQLWYPSRRRAFESPEVALEFAGALTDSSSGRRKYRDYLRCLTETDGEAKRLGFKKMSRGGVKESKDFKRSVLEDLKEGQMLKVVDSEASEMREPLWECAVARGLVALDREAAALSADKKGAGWKVDLARYLPENHLTPYRWIASSLHKGAPSYVQSLVSRQRKRKASEEWKILEKHENLG